MHVSTKFMITQVKHITFILTKEGNVNVSITIQQFILHILHILFFYTWRKTSQPHLICFRTFKIQKYSLTYKEFFIQSSAIIYGPSSIKTMK